MLRNNSPVDTGEKKFIVPINRKYTLQLLLDNDQSELGSPSPSLKFGRIPKSFQSKLLRQDRSATMSQHRPPTKSFEDSQEECLAKGLGPPNAITDLDSDSEPEAEEIE